MRTDVPGLLRLLLTVVVMAAAGAATWRVARVDWDLGYARRGGADADAGGASRARERLTEQPLDGAAFRALGERSAAQGDSAAALDFFQTAVRRDPRDPLVRIQLINIYLARADEPAALQHLDALLRISPAIGDPVLRRLVSPMASAAFSAALAKRVAEDPPWRELLPAALAASTDIASAEHLLADLGGRSRFRAPEVALRASLLERMARPRAARQVWRAGLPAELKDLDGLVFDGGFESGEGPQPYGWQWRSVASAVAGVDTSQPAEGRSALTLEFDGRIVDVFSVSQDLVLGPGLYRMDLQADIALDNAGRGFAWIVGCRDSSIQMARLQVPARTQGWQRFSVSFDVSPLCPRQRLELVNEGRNPGERRPSGRMAFDGVRIREMPP